MILKRTVRPKQYAYRVKSWTMDESDFQKAIEQRYDFVCFKIPLDKNGLGYFDGKIGNLRYASLREPWGTIILDPKFGTKRYPIHGWKMKIAEFTPEPEPELEPLSDAIKDTDEPPGLGF